MDVVAFGRLINLTTDQNYASRRRSK